MRLHCVKIVLVDDLEQAQVQSTVSSIKNDNWEVDMIQKLRHLQTKVDEILSCCKNKCLGKNETVTEEFCNEKLTTQTTALRPKTVKMILPVRKCISCPCPATPTTCPVMPFDHCPCNVQISQLLPCPIVSVEVIVPLDDKPAIEYLRRLGYVEEFNLSSANICHPISLSANVLSPDEKTAAVVPVPMQPFQAALFAQQQIPIQLLTNSMPQQFAFGGINGVQPLNFALVSQQQEKQQRMIPSGSAEQSKLTDLLASPPNTQLKINDDCQPPRITKSAAAARSGITLIALTVFVSIKSS
uniref:Protein muscleblind n=1 Tax=Loa loa TaxID=7209 RepID=A0A1I7VX87_LOALO